MAGSFATICVGEAAVRGAILAPFYPYPPASHSVPVRRIFALFLFAFIFACSPDDDVVVVKIILESATVAEQAVIGEALVELSDRYWTTLDRTAHADSYAYLDRLFDLLVVHPALQRRTAFDWRLHVLEDALSQEAFGFPGGQVFVTTGLLRLLESEDQLLAVLAHEMAYLDTDLAIDRLLGDKTIGGDRLGDLLIGRAPEDAAALLANIRAVDYGPEAVQAADSMMVNLLCPFKYRPVGLVDIYALGDAQGALPRWLERRATGREARLDWLWRAGYACDLNGVRNAAAYAAFLERL